MTWLCSIIVAPVLTVLLFSVARYLSRRIPIKNGALRRFLFFSWRV